MIVPPITLWLIWRVRSRLAVLAPRPSFLAVLLLAGVGFGWLLGELGAVNALSQFALVGMLILAVPAVLGWEVARRIAFPLFFLLFAVPFGDFTQPKLMQWTADATVFGLRLSGIPVFTRGSIW
jgi:exosortase